MPTASAIITASIRLVEFTSITRDASMVISTAMTTPIRAVADGHRGGSHGTEHHQQNDDGDHHAECLDDAQVRNVGGEDLAAKVHLGPGE